MAAKASKSRIPKPTMERAVKALLKWLGSNPTPKPSSDFICLVVTLKSVPRAGRPFSFQVPLPHPFTHPTLLLVDDSAARKNLHPLSLPVTDVVPFADADSFKFPSSGLLLLDRRVEKRFMKKRKNAEIGIKKGVRIATVDLARDSWREEARKECGLATVKFGGGNGTTVRVGRGNAQPREELMENVAAAVEGVVGRVPRGWRNVRAVHLKAAESVALPMYEAVEEEDDNTEEVAGEKKRKREE
ncbi:putative ribosomal L1 domain-containing protein 1 [Iris pallida]|uniref:Ribosomal L1 domain-containing protein 1 n=1 Tax=Iris pallida TaxID=29817 RepID=A0AAX6FBD5_IRIPA|nr:putative ribosomal L1 domain-containing protein 1 [Iris pallida]